jgi:soluble lytic murein transglycosylase
LHGLALLLKRNYAAAEKTFEKLIQALPHSDFVPQARYWSIRCEQLRGSPRDDVPSQYLQLVQLFPGTLYAILAQERLRELGEDPPLPFTDPPRVGDEPVPANLRLTAELVASGLLSDADREIETQVRGVRSEDQARHLGYVLQRLEAYGPAYALGARWLWKSAYVDRNGGALSLLYPQAYRDTVQRDAETEGIDPFLVWAVMRRESKFRADAHSTANARGLMQVIPSTGASIAKELALRRPAPNELFIPELNLRLGVWYLTRLVKRFGHPALIAAAYNAGPLVVAQWLEKYPGAPLDLFIEQMPYKETRNYVRQVVADYFIYHQLYGDPAQTPRLSLEIPQPSSAGVNF